MQAKAPLNANIGGIYSREIPVRWGDLDALNHVNNVAYFRYQEEARVQFLNDAGMSVPDNKIVILAHTSCDFIKPVFYPSTIMVEFVLVKLGNSSITFNYQMKCSKNPEIIYAKGVNVFVSANSDGSKSQPWTEAEIAAINSCLS